MHRNFDSRMETVAPATDPAIRAELERILDVYESDNTSAWDMQPDGHYVRRRPASGQPPREAQQLFTQLAALAFSSGPRLAKRPDLTADRAANEGQG
jgi:polyphosphate kinase